MRKIIVLAFFCCFFAASSFAQVGNSGAPIADVETEFMCWFNQGSYSTIQKATWYVAGQNAPVLTIYHDLDGVQINPTSETLLPGICAEDDSTLSADSLDFEYLVTLNCDAQGVTFYNVAQVVTNPDGSSTINVLNQYDAAWQPISVITQPFEPGPCNDVVYTPGGLFRQSYNSAGQVLGEYLSYEICNVGLSIGTVTISGIETELKPGECWSCAAMMDIADNTLATCGQFDFNATNTEFIVTTQSAP